MSLEIKKRLEDWVIKSLDSYDINNRKNSIDLMNSRLFSFPTDSNGSFRLDNWRILHFLYLTSESIGEHNDNYNNNNNNNNNSNHDNSNNNNYNNALSSLSALSLLLILTHIVHSCAYEMKADKGVPEVRMQNALPIKLC
jgi:hypothetical protein